MYDELVKRLREADISHPPVYLFGRAADAIEELSKPRWIPVTERLPDTYTPVLVTYIAYNSGEPFCDMCAYIDSDGEWIKSGEARTVMRPITHWMPLPSTEGLNET